MANGVVGNCVGTFLSVIDGDTESRTLGAAAVCVCDGALLRMEGV